MKRKKLAAFFLTSALAASMVTTGCVGWNLTQAETQSESQNPPSAPPSGEQPGTPPDGQGGPGGAPGGSSSANITYKGATEITAAAVQSDKTYASSTVDESALIVNTSEDVTLKNIKLTKTGSSTGGDSCNFYGLNAGLLVMGGSATTIQGGTIQTDADGANGVFSYGGNGASNGAAGDGTTVNISNVTIKTTGSGSGGIMTTGGGKTNAENLTITTDGGSSAPIRTDRGGGTVTVKGGTYTSNGLGSPAIYSTADITVSDATLVSNLSEGVCIEGKNSITLNNCDMTANNTKTNGNAQFYDTIMIYQSMSGDADSGTSSFTMKEGKLTSKNGHVFHVTNTNAVINLENVAVTNEDSKNVLLSVANDGWSGASNQATLNASKQTLNGDIIVSNAASSASSSKSTLSLILKDSSTYTGAIGDGSDNKDVGTVSVSIDSGSKWVLSGDSYITSITGSENIDYNGHTLYVNGTAYTASDPTGDVALTETDTESAAGTEDATADIGGDTAQELKTVSFKNVTKKISASKVAKKKVTYSVLKSSGVGDVSYKVTKGKAKYITVSKAGKVTVKKGAPKGTYKVLVKAAANDTYKSAAKKITIKVK